MTDLGPRPGQWVATAAIAVAAGALFWTQWWDGVPGALHLVGAERVLRGELPYRDFWTLYAPGSFALLAALFAVFGTHVLVSAAAGTTLAALAAAAFHRLVLGLAASPAAALAAAGVLVAALFGTPYASSLNTYPPVLLSIVLAWVALLRHLAGGRRAPLALAGLATGCAALFKHDVGAYTALAMGVALGVEGLARRRRPRTTLGALALFGGCAAAPVAAGLGPLALAAGADLWRDLIVFPATDFPLTRPEHYPSLLLWREIPPGRSALESAFASGRALAFALPLLGLLAGAARVMARGWRAAPARVALCAGFASAWGLHWNAAHVQINTHLVSMTLYGLLAAALALTPGPGRRGSAVALAGAALWAGALAAPTAWGRVFFLRHLPERTVVELPRLSGLRLFPSDVEDLRRLDALVRQYVPAGAPIFVGEHRHDMVIVSDPRLYFALDRPPATRYQELHPGVVNTARVQAEMIRDLERSRAPLVILRHRFPDDQLDRSLAVQRLALPSSGARDLDLYLAHRYTPLARVGAFEVRLRRPDGDQAAPAARRSGTRGGPLRWGTLTPGVPAAPAPDAESP